MWHYIVRSHCVILSKEDISIKSRLTPNAPKSFAWTTWRPKKTEESWLSCAAFHRHLTSVTLFNIYGGNCRAFVHTVACIQLRCATSWQRALNFDPTAPTAVSFAALAQNYGNTYLCFHASLWCLSPVRELSNVCAVLRRVARKACRLAQCEMRAIVIGHP